MYTVPFLDFPDVLALFGGPFDVSEVVEQLSACTLLREREREKERRRRREAGREREGGGERERVRE